MEAFWKRSKELGDPIPCSRFPTPAQGFVMSSIRIIRVLILLASVACVLIGFSGARGDLIIFKDGFVIRGKVQREVKTEITRTEEGPPIIDFIPAGFFFVDDGARRIIFSDKQLEH